MFVEKAVASARTVVMFAEEVGMFGWQVVAYGLQVEASGAQVVSCELRVVACGLEDLANRLDAGTLAPEVPANGREGSVLRGEDASSGPEDVFSEPGEA